MVVGTVIDPDMQNDMRVTVVATGLGESSREGLPKPAPVEEIAPVKLVNSDVVEAEPDDYRDLDRPTVLRNGAHSRQPASGGATEGNLDYLDIPAFLRRQAD